MKKHKITIIVLLIYFIAVFLFAFLQESELNEMAICCGIYNPYNRFFLPFPIIRSSLLMDFGPKWTELMGVSIFLDIMIPITLICITSLFDRVLNITK